MCHGQTTAGHITETNETSWWIYSGDHRIAGPWGIFTETQIRRAEFLAIWQQLQFRNAATYRFSPRVQVAAGYVWTRTGRYGDFRQPSQASSIEYMSNLPSSRSSGMATWSIAIASRSGGYRTIRRTVHISGDDRIAFDTNLRAAYRCRFRIRETPDGTYSALGSFSCTSVPIRAQMRLIRRALSVESDTSYPLPINSKLRISTSTLRSETAGSSSRIRDCAFSLVRQHRFTGRTKAASLAFPSPEDLRSRSRTRCRRGP
jgi:hypothetical protein